MAAASLFGGDLAHQVDPVVINYLVEIEEAQHARDHRLEEEVKASLMEYVEQYQDRTMFRPLPDWARRDEEWVQDVEKALKENPALSAKLGEDWENPDRWMRHRPQRRPR